MATRYYTASSLDGFIATPEHSLEWLLSQEIDLNEPMAYPGFVETVGALAMGASTYEWVMREDGRWGYTQPTWVFTHRDLPRPATGDVRLAKGDVGRVHAEMTAAADGRDLWIAGPRPRADRHGAQPKLPVRALSCHGSARSLDCCHGRIH